MDTSNIETIDRRLNALKHDLLVVVKTEVGKRGGSYYYEENVPCLAIQSDNCKDYYIFEIWIDDGNGNLLIRGEAVDDGWTFDFPASDVCIEHIRYLLMCMQ